MQSSSPRIYAILNLLRLEPAAFKPEPETVPTRPNVTLPLRDLIANIVTDDALDPVLVIPTAAASLGAKILSERTPLRVRGRMGETYPIRLERIESDACFQNIFDAEMRHVRYRRSKTVYD
jgi:hypothetical protein